MDLPIAQVEKLSLKEGSCWVHSHTAKRLEGWGLNPGLSDLSDLGVCS